MASGSEISYSIPVYSRDVDALMDLADTTICEGSKQRHSSIRDLKVELSRAASSLAVEIDWLDIESDYLTPVDFDLTPDQFKTLRIARGEVIHRFETKGRIGKLLVSLTNPGLIGYVEEIRGTFPDLLRVEL